MIDATGLTKVFGDKVAVDNLSFSVRSGMVTGFLGPNGAGKSTTMRMILGLDHPTKGHCRVNGRSYRYTKAPMTEVGALLEAKSVHPGRTARSHLKALAATHGIGKKRVDEVIELVGLGAVANKRAGDYSLGMSQRLGLATALLGDPETLILDEPINGLDPEGVAWVRSLLKYLAEEGRTVFISSHLMSEMAMTADHILIIGRGRLIADSPMSDLIDSASGRVIKVRSPNTAQIREVVTRSGRTVTDTEDGAILISGLSAEAIGKEATRRGWVLYELTPVQRSLEDIYMELTNSSQEFRSEGHFNELAAGHPIEVVPVRQAEEEYEDDEDEPEEPEEPVRRVRVRDETYDVPTRTPSRPVSRPAAPDEDSRTTTEVRAPSPRYDPGARPRIPDPETAVRPRIPDPDVLVRPRIPDPDVLVRPRIPDPDVLVRPRIPDPDVPVRPRIPDPDVRVRPRISGSDSLYGSRPTDPMPRPRLAGSDSASSSRPRPIIDPLPRPRSADSDLRSRPRPIDPEPMPRPRLGSVDSGSSTSDPGLRRTDPLKSRFMDTTDTDYRTRLRPTDSDVYRSRSDAETSADPLRLPRPRAEQDSLPFSEPKPSKTSDPNRPRRAWGV